MHHDIFNRLNQTCLQCRTRLLQFYLISLHFTFAVLSSSKRLADPLIDFTIREIFPFIKSGVKRLRERVTLPHIQSHFSNTASVGARMPLPRLIKISRCTSANRTLDCDYQNCADKAAFYYLYVLSN